MVTPPTIDDADRSFGSSVRQCRTLALFTLAAITLVAVWLRWRQASESLWLDELHTAWTVDAGLPSIGPRARAGNYGPVYFLFPWISTRFFGLQEWSLRLPSLLAGIALVPVGYAVSRNWFQSRTIGCLTAAFIATDPHALFYSLDARPYALVQLGAVLHVALLVRLLNGRRRCPEYLVYCLLGAGLFQLHYTSALLFGGEVALILLWRIQGRRQQVSKVLLWTVVMGFSCCVSLADLRQIAGRRELWHQFIDREASLGDIFPFAEYLGTAVVAMAFCWLLGQVANRRVDETAVRIVRGITARCTLSPLGPGKGEGSENTSVISRTILTRPTLPLVWSLIWLAVPLCLALALTRWDIARLLYRRYVMFSYPPLVLLSAGIGALCPSRRARTVYALIVLTALNTLLGPWQLLAHDGRTVRHSHEDWRGAVGELNAIRNRISPAADQPLPVLMRPGLVEERPVRSPADIETAEDYLLFPVSSIYRLNVEHEVHILTSSLEITERARSQLRSSGGCWLLVRGKYWFELNSTALISRLQQWVGKESRVELDQRRDFGNVIVVRCRMGMRMP